jgi:hypothetical protein
MQPRKFIKRVDMIISNGLIETLKANNDPFLDYIYVEFEKMFPETLEIMEEFIRMDVSKGIK